MYNKTKEHRKNLSISLKGKKKSKEHIENISKALKGKHLSPTEFKKGHISPTKGKENKWGNHTEEAKIRISENHRHIQTKETKIKISESKKELYKDYSKHPNWQGGKSFEPYGPEFNKQLKNKIKKRDNYKCIFCELEYEKEKENLKDHPILWQKKLLLLKIEANMNKRLSIHHIDYNKQNNSEDNLITLCSSHHAKTNFNREYWIAIFNQIKEFKKNMENFSLIKLQEVKMEENKK